MSPNAAIGDIWYTQNPEKLKRHISISIKRQLHWVIPAGQIVIERIPRIMENRWGCNSESRMISVTAHRGWCYSPPTEIRSTDNNVLEGQEDRMSDVHHARRISDDLFLNFCEIRYLTLYLMISIWRNIFLWLFVIHSHKHLACNGWYTINL